MENPYKTQPRQAFWSKAVTNGYLPETTFQSEVPLIARGERVASAGSCFASNLVPWLEKTGIEYIRAEAQNPVFCGLDQDGFGYSNFSAAYGNIYTARQFLQLILRATGAFHPREDRWIENGFVVDPFRPGMKYKARVDQEFDVLREYHFRKVVDVLRKADVFIFTLGLTEAWISNIDGAVFPACPGTVAGVFDGTRHAFHNFNVAEVAGDLTAAIDAARTVNPNIRFIVTVSPLPLVATATSEHVLTASLYSKSVLRVAADMVARGCPDVAYFPAYEIVTGPQAPRDFFESDRRNVSSRAIETVMAAFLAHCRTEGVEDIPTERVEQDHGALLSSSIAEGECEEVMADR